MRVLIVDDDKWYAESLASSLQSNNITTKTAFCAEEAIEAIDDNIPDAILLDASLGARNALTLLNELQSYGDTRKIPVVVMSNNDMSVVSDDLAQYGVRAVLHKATIIPEEVLQCLKV